MSRKFVGFDTGVYAYPRSRDRRDGIVRLRGFADTISEAWVFIARHRRGDGQLDAVYEGDERESLVNRDGSLNQSGLKLLWELMPDDVRLAALVLGGNHP